MAKKITDHHPKATAATHPFSFASIHWLSDDFIQTIGSIKTRVSRKLEEQSITEDCIVHPMKTRRQTTAATEQPMHTDNCCRT
mmetsp:Transcript_6589/g.10694  ORF Transcript_6589/g.10694 Transcript_6589/m.10694 type:complete len:83 (+) Transcript_6589:72-320(+)